LPPMDISRHRLRRNCIILNKMSLPAMERLDGWLSLTCTKSLDFVHERD
jgi:hypothetical protein